MQQFLNLVKIIYTDLPDHMPKIFEPVQQIRVKDLKDLNFEKLLSEAFSIKSIHVENQNDSTTVQMVSLK